MSVCLRAGEPCDRGVRDTQSTSPHRRRQQVVQHSRPDAAFQRRYQVSRQKTIRPVGFSRRSVFVHGGPKTKTAVLYCCGLICQVDVQLNSAMPLISGKLIDVIDHHEKIFLITYFRTTPMADVNFTSLVTSLIMCHHCVSHLLYPPFYASPMASSAL